MKEQPIEMDGERYVGTTVSMGNPHLVIFVNDIEAIDLTVIGPKLENHPLFPGRINVEFAQILGEGKIRMRVWERGSGITQACGTGACATAVAASSPDAQEGNPSSSWTELTHHPMGHRHQACTDDGRSHQSIRRQN